MSSRVRSLVGGALLATAGGLCCIASCGPSQTAASRQPPPAPLPSMPTPAFPDAAAAGCDAEGGACRVLDAAAQTDAGGAALDTAAPAPRPGTVPGGLARGDGSPADSHLLDGDKAYLADRHREAHRHYSKAKRLAPKDPAPAVGLIRVAIAASKVPKDYAGAPNHPRVKGWLRQLDGVLKNHPEFGPAHLERGRLLLMLGKAKPAREALEEAKRRLPRDPEARSALGVALLASGRAEDALTELGRAAHLDPDNPDRLTNWGTALMMRGRVKEAIRAYERAVQLAPNDPRAQGDLGTAYLSANDVHRALPYLKRAVKLAPGRATFRSNLGYAYQLSGKLDLAISTYREALKKDPKLGSAWINLGTALAKKKRYSEAEAAFRKALALDPTDPRAKANLAELRQLKTGGGKGATP